MGEGLKPVAKLCGGIRVTAKGETVVRAARSEPRQSLDGIANNLVVDHSAKELAIGYARYEALRKLNPRQFEVLHLRSVAGHHENFDEMVDDIVMANVRRARTA